MTDSRSSHRRCSVRKGVHRNFTKFIGKHLCQSLSFNKVAGLRPQACIFIKKETLAQVFSREFRKISMNTFSYRTPPADCFCDRLSDVSFGLPLCSDPCFVNTDTYLLKGSTVVSEIGTLFFRCCAVIEQVSAWRVVWCLDRPGIVLGSVFCYCSVVCLILSLLQDLATVCILRFSFKCHRRHFTVQRNLLRTYLTHSLSLKFVKV